MMTDAMIFTPIRSVIFPEVSSDFELTDLNDTTVCHASTVGFRKYLNRKHGYISYGISVTDHPTLIPWSITLIQISA